MEATKKSQKRQKNTGSAPTQSQQQQLHPRAPHLPSWSAISTPNQSMHGSPLCYTSGSPAGTSAISTTICGNRSTASSSFNGVTPNSTVGSQMPSPQMEPEQSPVAPHHIIHPFHHHHTHQHCSCPQPHMGMCYYNPMSRPMPMQHHITPVGGYPMHNHHQHGCSMMAPYPMMGSAYNPHWGGGALAGGCCNCSGAPFGGYPVAYAPHNPYGTPYPPNMMSAAHLGHHHHHTRVATPPPSAATSSANSKAASPAQLMSEPITSVIAERFKTRLCQAFADKGKCPYYNRCMFAHGGQELRTMTVNLECGLISEEAVTAHRREQRSLAYQAKKMGISFTPFSNAPVDPRLLAGVDGGSQQPDVETES